MHIEKSILKRAAKTLSKRISPRGSAEYKGDDVPEALLQPCQFVEDHYENHFDWIGMDDVPDEQLIKILQPSFIHRKEKDFFDPLVAHAEIIKLQQNFPDAGHLHLAHPVATTGIQEKYLKSQLTLMEPLTLLDMQRFIVHTGMQGHIQVTNLDVEAIGLLLHYARLAHKNSNAAYSVAMMVKTDSDAWLSVVVTCDPVSGKVTHKINSAEKLNENSERQITQTITDALTFSRTSTTGEVFEAFPHANIQSEFGVRRESDRQQAGYQVLHALYTDAVLQDAVRSQPNAEAFSRINPAMPDTLRDAVYTTELRAIRLSETEAKVLPLRQTRNFSKGILQEDALEQQLRLLAFSPPHEQGLHPLVSAKVSELKLTQEKLVFPGEKPEQRLSGADYQQFLLLTDKKFAQAGTHKKLDELTIVCYDAAALEGLIAFQMTKASLPCKTLVLDVSQIEAENEELFVFRLKTLLVTLKDLPMLQLVDTSGRHLTAELVGELTDLVRGRQIAIDITLPDGFANKQKEIDMFTSDAIRAREMAVSGKAKAEEKREDLLAHDMPVRKRPRLSGKQAAQFDIEMQQEQQVEVAVESGTQMAAGAGGGEGEDIEVYDIDRFVQAIRKGELGGKVNRDADARALWWNWVGALTPKDNDEKCLKLSRAACEEFLRYQDKFQYGLDLKKLPAGCSIQQQGNVRFVHFDPQLKALTKMDPLTVQTIPATALKPLTFSQVETCLKDFSADHPARIAWLKLQNPYEKISARAFRILLPQILQLEVNQQKELFDSCFELHALGGEHFNGKTAEFQLKSMQKIPASLEGHALGKLIDTKYREKIQLFITKYPGINLNAMLALYVDAGESGIDRLIQLADKNPVLFERLNTLIFSSMRTYSPLLTDEYSDAMTALDGFPPAWWNTLLEQHCHSQNDVNLVELVDAFKAFNEKLKELSPEGQPLHLPSECHLTDVKSLPVALSRMIQLLEHARVEDRQAQLNELMNLDLSATGTIKAVTNDERKHWAFATPEMWLTQEAELKQEGDDITTYKAPVEVGHYEKGDIQLQQDFFRYVATCGRGKQFPQAFYRLVHETIQAEGDRFDTPEKVTPFVNADRCTLYKLMAMSTTGENAGFASAENAEQRFREFWDILDKVRPPVPIPNVPETICRSVILDGFSKLHEVPPFPVLLQFTKVISANLSLSLSPNPLRNLLRLKEGMVRVNEYLDLHKTCVYDGFRDYDDEDLKTNSEIFFDHLDMIKKINSMQEVQPDTQARLVAIISTFHLSVREADAIPQRYSREQTEALLLLGKISSKANGHPKLKLTDLQFILQAVEGKNEPVADILAKLALPNGIQIKDYFYPHDYLDKYRSPGVSDDVKKIIDDHFNSQQAASIESILYQFKGREDNQYYAELVNKLITITESMGQVEKNIFIQKLRQHHGFYIPEEQLNGKNAFVRLLDRIIESGSAEDFLNLLAATEEEKISSHLSQRSLVYLDHLLPDIRQMPNLAYSGLEIEPVVQRTILTIPESELEFVKNKKMFFPENSIYINQEIELRIAENITKSIHLRTLQSHIKQFNKDPFTKSQKTLMDDYTRNLDVGYMRDTSEHQDSCRYLFVKMRMIPKEIFDQQMESHPFLANNRDLIDGLIANAAFNNKSLATPFNELRNMSSTDYARAENQSKITALFDALEEDAKELDKFRTDTRQIKQILGDERKKKTSSMAALQTVFGRLDNIAATKPYCKKQLLELYDRYLMDCSSRGNDEEGIVGDLFTFAEIVDELFKNINDRNIVLSLCLQFNRENDPEMTPEKLLELLVVVYTHPPEKREALLKMAVALINNEKGYSFSEFASICAMNPSDYIFEFIKDTYQHPPYPTIKNVLEWHAEASEKVELQRKSHPSRSRLAEVLIARDREDERKVYLTHMKGKTDLYGKSPCHREVTDADGKPLNGFHVSIAEAQLKKMQQAGLEQKIDLALFERITVEMRDKSMDELLTLLKTFRGAENVDYYTLVAVAAELFHRSMGKDELNDNGTPRMGSSMEINSTQYLAILTSQMTEGHVTSQIGTGEGKSRIMMISIACQFALGKTVDFITSDAQLATRDYIAHQAYFETIGAKTSMIFANSDPSSYQVGGINFSDPSNLSLFRNKARSTGQGDKVIDPEELNRTLLLDEADKLYLDMADTRFNFSREGDESIRGMEWVYPLLMEYFSQTDAGYSPMDVYFDNMDESRDRLMAFAIQHCNPQQIARLRALPYNQIEQWQVSAVTAMQLKFNEDFVIQPDILVATSQGPKTASDAQLLFAKRASPSSRYSYGVHQCLDARLNIEKRNLDHVTDDKLREKLQGCERDFYIADEKQIIYSSTSKNLLDDYADSTIKGVTGTTGSMLELEETRKLYGSAGLPMQFIDVPRDRGIHRRDRYIRLTANPKQQIDILVEQIKMARSKNQPILIIAEDDRESAALYVELDRIFGHDRIQHIHSQLSLVDEKKRIDVAGNPCQITVSTEMIGRGTDISLRGDAKVHGLNVMLTYLPRPRDFEQIIGRSGRFGAKGESSMALDRQRLEKAFGKTLNDEFFMNMEAYIEREQALMDRRKQCERLIKNTVGDFRKDITDAFFDQMLKFASKQDQKKLLPAWTSFFEKSDKLWNEKWPHIQAELNKESIDTDKIENLFREYEEEVQKLWGVMRRQVFDANVVCVDNSKPADRLPVQIADIGRLKLSKETVDLLHGFDLRQYPLVREMKVYTEFEPGHEGRVVMYADRSTPLVASLKGFANLFLPKSRQYDNARHPFANTRAWLEGRGQLFAESRASKNKGWIIGTTILSTIGIAVGAAMVATGFLAPIGIGLISASVLVGAVSWKALAEVQHPLVPAKQEIPPEEIKPVKRYAAIQEIEAGSKSRMNDAHYQLMDEKEIEHVAVKPGNQADYSNVKVIVDQSLPLNEAGIAKYISQHTSKTGSKKVASIISSDSMVEQYAVAGKKPIRNVFVTEVSKLISDPVNIVSVRTGNKTDIYASNDSLEKLGRLDMNDKKSLELLYQICQLHIEHHIKKSDNASLSINATRDLPDNLREMFATYCHASQPPIRFTSDGGEYKPANSSRTIEAFVTTRRVESEKHIQQQGRTIP